MLSALVPSLSALLALFGLDPCANKEWDQCGGSEWTGPTCCPSFDSCVVVNTHYSQCQPKNVCKVPDWGQCGPNLDPQHYREAPKIRGFLNQKQIK